MLYLLKEATFFRNQSVFEQGFLFPFATLCTFHYYYYSLCNFLKYISFPGSRVRARAEYYYFVSFNENNLSK